jgi:hypothetical protein
MTAKDNEHQGERHRQEEADQAPEPHPKQAATITAMGERSVERP